MPLRDWNKVVVTCFILGGLCLLIALPSAISYFRDISNDARATGARITNSNSAQAPPQLGNGGEAKEPQEAGPSLVPLPKPLGILDAFDQGTPPVMFPVNVKPSALDLGPPVPLRIPDLPWWIPFMVPNPPRVLGPWAVARGCAAEPLIGSLELVFAESIIVTVVGVSVELRNPRLPDMLEKILKKYERRENLTLTSPIRIILFPFVSYTPDGKGCYVDDYAVQ